MLTPACRISCVLIFMNCFCLFADEVQKQRGQNAKPVHEPLILAHYMPWYSAKPFSDQWGWHWTMNHFDPEKEVNGHRQIASKYHPLIGPYDSGDPHVLEYHLLLMRLSGIDGVIVDWYGLTDYRDYAVLHRNTTRLLQQCERLKMKFVICYEDQTIPALVEGQRVASSDRVSHAIQEIDWLGKYWFKSGSYVKLDGKPVLLSFGHSGLNSTEWAQCLSGLESPVAYFSQDVRRDGAIGGFGWPAPKVGLIQVDRFRKDAARWPEAIPAAFPRFDDIYREANVGESYPQLPDDSGRTFVSTVSKALEARSRMIQIATWNDWGEGTQIEPSVEFGFRDLEHLQSVRSHSPRASNGADLRLPEKLLQRRRSTTDLEVQKKLDETAQLIINGNVDEARRRLNVPDSKMPQ